MKARLTLTFIFTALFFLFPKTIFAQPAGENEYAIPDSNQVQVVRLHNGSVMRGSIISVHETEIEFQAEFGVMNIPKHQIASIKTINQTRTSAGDFWFENPNRTRLYFMPTGRMLRQGQGYFSDYYLFFPGFAYGMSDNFTMGGGMSLIPGADIDEQLLYLTPKLGVYQSEKTNAALGVLLIKLPFADKGDPKFTGILYGVSTFGSPDLSATLGLGYGFVDSNLAEKPMVTLGLEMRLSERVSFVSENWFMPGVDNPLISYGLRFMGSQMAVDLSLLNTIGEDAIPLGVPFVGFIYNF